ncbi:MAG: sugar-binding protein, partial [candidate division WOR-3 bacterium]
MKKNLMLFLKFIILILLGVPMLISAPVWKLVWSDEFDYNGPPDPNKWGYDIGGGGWGNQELQYYTNRLENARVENGKLIIEARKENYNGYEYTSARLKTRYKGDWLYGRFEIRAKLPGGRGTWPAIWMLPTDWVYGGWPSSGEIDIMECVGYDPTRVYSTIHTEAYNHMLGTQKGGSIVLSPAPQDVFYTYICEWYPDRIDFYVDTGSQVRKVFTFNKESDDYRVWPFNQRFHLILNIAVGGTWGGAQGVDPNIFPQRMEVEYVRVYQLVEDPELTQINIEINPSQAGVVNLSPAPSEGNTYALNTQVTLTAVANTNNWEFFEWSGDLSTKNNPAVVIMNSNKNITANFTTAIYKYYAYKVSTSAIVVDGSLDEKYWCIFSTISKPVIGSFNNKAYFGVLWDSQNLYVGIEVEDTSLISNDSSNLWEDDSVEVYLDVEHNHKSSYDTYDTQFIKGYGVSTIWERSGRINGVKHAYSTTSTGYSVEIAIPWANLGVIPSVGMMFGFDVGINDDDDGGSRDSQAMWAGTANNYLTTQYFGDLILADYLQTGEEEQEPPITYHTLNLTINPQEAGVVASYPISSNNQYPHNTLITLQAIPRSGWKFINWSGDIFSTSTLISLIMDNDKSLTANFEQTISTDTEILTYKLDLVILPSTSTGKVILDPPGGIYTRNTVVVLVAQPSSGYKFLGWSGDIYGSSSYITITMDSDKIVVANFVE